MTRFKATITIPADRGKYTGDLFGTMMNLWMDGFQPKKQGSNIVLTSYNNTVYPSREDLVSVLQNDGFFEEVVMAIEITGVPVTNQKMKAIAKPQTKQEEQFNTSIVKEDKSVKTLYEWLKDRGFPIWKKADEQKWILRTNMSGGVILNCNILKHLNTMTGVEIIDFDTLAERTSGTDEVPAEYQTFDFEHINK